MSSGGFSSVSLSEASPLTDADYANLTARWIDQELADAAGIRRVSSQLGASFVGRKDKGSFSGLVIPYVLPGEPHVREFRLRRDRPDLEYKGDKVKEQGKYLWPPGRRNMIYFPPNIPPAILKSAAIPVVVTEGEFKALALWRLATHRSDAPRFLPIGLGGVWNWRGVVGKTNGPDGERRDVKGVIPDLDLIAWESRRVIVAFDADVDKNPAVEAARAHLSRELRVRGAEVGSVRWDIADGKGIDDLLAKVGPEKVQELLDGAESGQEDADSITVAYLAEAMTSRFSFAKDAGGRLYVYRSGCYQTNGTAVVHQQVKRLLEHLKAESKWTSHKSEEVVRYIAVDAPLLTTRPPSDIVNVINGLLNVTTGRLDPHSPDFLSCIQVPVKYDPRAKCPAWEKFVGEVFPEDAGQIAWEIVAWLMTPDTSIQKAILLTGDGANGKSTFLKAVLAFIGRHNASAVSLHRLETDRFSVARLMGKLANVCPDLPTNDLESTSVFKAITGGDALQAERKFEESFEFAPYARLIFSANHPPKSQDASSAFFRRWHVVPFEQIFQPGSPGFIPSNELDAALSDPAELSGVLNRALGALAGLRRRGLTESESTRRAMDDFRQATDPFAVWLDQNTSIQSGGFIAVDHLWKEYNRHCFTKGRPQMTKTALGRAIAQLRPSVEKCQRTINDANPWCYVGIELISKAPE